MKTTAPPTLTPVAINIDELPVRLDINGVKIILYADPCATDGLDPVPLDPKELDPERPRAAKGFVSIWWNGQLFHLTPRQRPVIQALWVAWRNGVDYMSGSELLELAECKSASISDIFKRSPAWKNLVVPSSMIEDAPRDSYRLAPLVSYSV